MGLKDWYLKTFGGGTLDHREALDEAMGAEGPCSSYALVIPSAYERSGGGGNNLASFALNKAVNAGLNAAAQSKHIGGAPGSIARSIPLDDGMLVLAVSPAGLTFWDFGQLGRDIPPKRRMRIGPGSVAGFRDTGRKAQGGVRVARLSFVDDSFIDYRVMMESGPELWSELDSLSA